jgi:Na+/H+-dicarboxylate symporter
MLFFVVIPLVFASLVDMFMPRNHFGAFVGSNRNQLGEVLPLIAFGIPPEGIGIVLGVDRILDMTRTMVNVGSDMVTTTVVEAAARRSEQRSAARASSA